MQLSFVGHGPACSFGLSGHACRTCPCLALAGRCQSGRAGIIDPLVAPWPLSKRSSRHHRSPGGAHAPRPLVYHLRWLWPGGCEHSCELWRSSSSQTSRESSFDYVPRKPCRNSLLGNLPCDVIDRPCIALPSSILRPRPAKGHQAARVDRTCDMCFRVPTYALRLVPPQSRALLP